MDIRRTDAGLAFAAPPVTRSGPLEAELLADVVAALGIADDGVVDSQWVDNGPGWLAVLLASAEDVLAIEPTFMEQDIGVVGPSAPGAEEAIEVRAFFPKDGALHEDPVTGSLNASLAQWLTDSGHLEAPYVARQGTALGRAGRVHVTRDDRGVWVGGATETVIEGSLDVRRA